MFAKKLLAVLIGILLLCTACAHLALNPKSPEELRKRVQELWEAKKRGDWGEVYDMTTSAYRSKVTKSSFLSSPKINTLGFTVENIKILEPGTEALVIVKATLDMMGRPFPMQIKEHWLWEDEEWRLNIVPTPFQSLFQKPPPAKKSEK